MIPFGPVSVSIPAMVALMVEAELVLVFSTRMSLVMEPALMMSTEVKVPNDGSNWPTPPLNAKLVCVVGKVSVLVSVCGVALTVASWSN